MWAFIRGRGSTIQRGLRVSRKRSGRATKVVRGVKGREEKKERKRTRGEEDREGKGDQREGVALRCDRLGRVEREKEREKERERERERGEEKKGVE